MVIFSKSWNTMEIPGDLEKKVNVEPIIKKVKQDGLGNYRLVSLTEILGKIAE